MNRRITNRLPLVTFLLAFGSGQACVSRSQNSAPRIVAGVLVEEDDPVYRSAVSLDHNGSPVCSGFVFDKRTIVTAAHCLAGPPLRASDITVTFGSKNRQLNHSVEVPAAQVYAHGAWDRGDLGRVNIDPMPETPKNDIGILVLSEEVPPWVVPLPVKEIGSVDVGREVVLAGYGQTRAMPEDGPSTEAKGLLRKTKVQLQTINEPGHELIWQSPGDNARASACHGDSGGPMYFVENDQSLTLIGVNSRRYSAALDCKQKGIYTDVRRFVAWIKSNRDRLLAATDATAGWQHRYFTSKDGTKLSLDFKLVRRGAEYLGGEVWLNVYNPRFSGQENVTATLSSYINSLTQQQLKMSYADNHRFTARFDTFSQAKVCALSSRWGVQQDIVVDVNGSALKDSVSGEDTFIFRFCESN